MIRTIIIAEAGVNHNGDMGLAVKLVDAAVSAGVDYVKFQTFKAEKLTSKFAEKAQYQKETTDRLESQYEMLRRLELSEADHVFLIEYCKKKGIKFLSTPFDLESADLLSKLGVSIGKIPSGEITNLPYLRKMAKTFPQIILSTGMSNLMEINAALEVLFINSVKKENVTVLHCNTEYPTPFSDVNLRVIPSLKEELGLSVGYSDHTIGIEVPIAAVALGATMIEKHFTLDRRMEGPDHKASLEPAELIAMVKAIRNVELSMGIDRKAPTVSEIKNISVARKSIVASCDIAAGETFSESNLTVKRPGTGLSPMMWDNVIGIVSNKSYRKDDLIEL